jgi:hypothetical protein
MCGMSNPVAGETSTQNYNTFLLLLTKYRDEQESRACLMNKHWRNFFRSGLACASDGGDIVGPEKCRLSEAGRA